MDAMLDYPKGPKLVIITVALRLSVFYVALDNIIIPTVIPRIIGDFHDLQDIDWYGLTYLLIKFAFYLQS